MAVLHTETLDLEHNGSRLTGVLVRPEGDDPLPGVVQIQEWWGIEPHVIEVSHRLAAEGFVVLVPDLYHGKVVTEPDEAGKAVMMIAGNLDNAVREVQVAIDYLKARSDVAPQQVGLTGYCVGGLLAWRTALQSPDVAAVVPWYGLMIDLTPEQIATLQVPVLAFYGGKDTFVPLEQAQRIKEVLEGSGKEAEVIIYPEAGHAFLNPNHGDLHEESANDAWPRMVRFFKQYLVQKPMAAEVG